MAQGERGMHRVRVAPAPPAFCLLLFTLDLWESATPAAISLSLPPPSSFLVASDTVPLAHSQSEGFLRKAAPVAHSLLITSLLSLFCIQNSNPLPSMEDFTSNDVVITLQG